MYFFFFQKKKQLNKEKHIAPTAIKEGNTTVKSKEQITQIIDTTLLKCYLQVSFVLLYNLYSTKQFSSTTLYHTVPIFQSQEKKKTQMENIVEKGRNAGNRMELNFSFCEPQVFF